MENGTAGLDISQAAAALGVSADVVRKRVRRGRLQAYKLDGRWKVVLPTVQEPVQANGQGGPVDHGLDHGQDNGGPAGDSAVTLIAQLRAENDHLWRLTEHQAGVIAQMAARMAALLPAPASVSDATGGAPAASTHAQPETPHQTSVPRRPWWRRLFGAH